VLHLLYSRFWHKFLYDLGYVSTKEPFRKLINQGMILGEDGQKMSKSRGNVVNPDKVISDYGADSMRLYEMFMGPLEAMKPWSMQGVQGVHRFLQKAWRLIVDEETGDLAGAIQDAPVDEETLRLLHQTIKKVGGDIETFGFNTAISAMMILVNHVSRLEVRPRAVVEPFVLLLAPFAPHIAEELWQRLGHAETLAYEPWPQHDDAVAREKEVELAVQVNGKIKDRIVVDADADEEQIKARALAMSMHAEIEAKLKVNSLEAVEQRLAECGASFRAEKLQTDCYFDTADRELTRTDQCVRLRREKKGDRERLVITYKGAKQADDYKKRREIEFEVQDAEQAEAFLDVLGYRKALVFNKRRRLWDVGDCEVALDELPLIGVFVEIEGPNSDEIRRVQVRLALTDVPHVMDSYATLIAERLARLGRNQTEVFL